MQGKTQYEGYRWLDLHKGLILEARELQAQQQGAPRQQRLGVAARLASLVRGQPRPQVTKDLGIAFLPANWVRPVGCCTS